MQGQIGVYCSILCTGAYYWCFLFARSVEQWRSATGGLSKTAGPWRWCCASAEAIQFWINEGVDGALDLASMYTSTTEVRASLLQAGLHEDDVARGILPWLDAPRAAQATAAKVLDENVLKSTQGIQRPGNIVHQLRNVISTTPDLKPPSRVKRKRIALNAPGPLHQEWQKARKLEEARAREEQGLSEAREDALEDSEKHAKELFFRPFRRFADSVRARLAPMARWEAWLKTEGCHTEDNAYAPEDVLLGKFLLSVSQGGPTSAAAVWWHLQRWVRHLGLSLPFVFTTGCRLQVCGNWPPSSSSGAFELRSAP